MGKINVLSFAVANLIAAGEVVDRPSSVIKELLENAIDSGATQVTVEIQNGGVTYMRVSDNGCGMTPEDLPVAIRRHATSKIKNAEDLNGIITLGFRGEALAAIAAVSDMRIISKTSDAEIGAMLEARGGNIIGVTPRACANGTSVVVEELFANVPARRKFLKKDITESMAVSAMVEKIALSRPDIAFKLIIDGTVKLQSAGDGKLQSAIYSVFGREFATRLLQTELEVDGIKVRGFIGRPDNVRANRNYQNFFINGRYVKSRTALAAIEQAYNSYIAAEKFPCCVLFIDINPSTVDVNVHPAKLEVKFSNEKPVFEAIYYATRNALERNTERPNVTLSQQQNKTRVSDMTLPIEDGKRESLKARQLQTELYVKSDEKKSVSGSSVGGFEHISAEEYVKKYSQDASASKSYTVGNCAHKVPQKGVCETAKNTCDSLEPKAQNNNEASQKTSETVAAMAVSAGSDDMSANSAEALVSQASTNEKKNETSSAIDQRSPSQTSDALDTEVLSETREKFEASPKTSGKSLKYRIIGEAFNSYVLVEKEDKLLLIDKHAAHERILFEKMRAAMKNESERASQLLIMPSEMMMLSFDMDALREYKAEIVSLGFDIALGHNILMIMAIPEGFDIEGAKDMLSILADRLRSNTGTVSLTRDIIFEKALYQASCKAAIKAGREYPPEYVEWIVEKLMELPDITVCPHGRPVAMELSKKNLDNQFERS